MAYPLTSSADIARPELVVAASWVDAALEVIRETSPRTIALAGGSTPRPLYERLRDLDLPWGEIECFFTDERCVPPESPALNFGMVQRALLGMRPRPRLHPMPFATRDPESYEALIEERLGASPALDLAILGLGADGHTASLFPGDAALEEREHLVRMVERPDYPRITMTLPLLSASKVALFVVTGAEKRDALRGLLEGEDIPASHVRAARVVVVADPPAAGEG
ncbi:MAG: 6-phosphogluconolactonase [Dehalococcoidia bacterium]|nr:6-phosphogluconolactonase [Dehalococcoidia bacterium]